MSETTETPIQTGIDPRGQQCLVTGAARGIGLALCHELRARGAGKIIMLDENAEALHAAANELHAIACVVDLADADSLTSCLNSILTNHGAVALLFSNAGILRTDSSTDPSGAEDEHWQQCWDVNLMAHVRLLRTLLPPMLEHGGWIVLTASAAGLLTLPDSATYSVTKHAVLGYADYLSIRYADAGIGVSVLCPQAVDTDMIKPFPDGGIAGLDGIVSAEAVASQTISEIMAGNYLILPHAQVARYVKHRAEDHSRWLNGMRKAVKLVNRNREN